MEKDVALIAPCGMNCAICMAFLRTKNKCNGCRCANTWNPKTREECRIKNCPNLADQGRQYCYQCPDFPCQRLRNLDKRYRTRYRMSMLENLAAVQSHGAAEFMADQEKRWTCSGCGGTINVHRHSCSTCGQEG